MSDKVNAPGSPELFLPHSGADWYTLHATSLALMRQIYSLHDVRDLLRARRAGETDEVKKRVLDYFISDLNVDLMNRMEVLYKNLTELLAHEVPPNMK